MWDRIKAWCNRWFDSTDAERDIKLLAFAVTIAFGLYWLTREQSKGPITSHWVDAFMWLLAATSLGGALWTAIDKFKGNANAPKPSSEPGTEDQEGKP